MPTDTSRAAPLFSTQQLNLNKISNAALRAYPGTTACEDYTFSLQTGDPSNSETIFTVRTLPDGNYILGGAVKSGAEQAGLLIKLNKDGTIQWTNKYAQAGFNTWYKNIQATDDGGCIAAGISQQTAGGQTYVLISKFSATGSQQWNQQFNYAGIDVSAANTNVVVQDDGSYAFSGHSGAGILVGTLNNNGSMKWLKQLSFGGDHYYTVGVAASYDAVLGAVATMDSGMHISYVYKLDRTNGNTMWSCRLGRYASGQEYLFQQMEQVNLRPRICGLFRKTAASPWEFSRITINPTGYVESGDYFGLPAAPDTTSFSGTTPWSEYQCISLSANANEVYLVKAIPDLYTKNYWCHKITQPIPFTVSAVERSFDGGIIMVGNSPVNNGDIMITKTDSSGFLQTCPSNDIPYTHRYENNPPHAKNTFSNSSINVAPINLTLNQATSPLVDNVFCRQLYCQPLPDTSCLSTFYNSYRDYYFSQAGLAMAETAAGDLIIGGSSRDNPYEAKDRGLLMLLNKSGTVLSAKNIDYGDRGVIQKILPLQDKSLITVGQGVSGSNYATVLSRYDKNLNLQWEKSFLPNLFTDALVDKSDNIYYTSLVGMQFVDQRLVMTKLDPAGNVVWRNMYNYPGKSVYYADGGQTCMVNDLLFTSISVSLNNRIATLLLCFNSNDGSVKWSRIIEAVGSTDVRISWQLFVQNNLLYLNGNVQVNGQSYPGTVLVEVDLNGNVLRNKRIFSPLKQFSFRFIPGNDGTIIGLGSGYDYNYTPALPVRMFIKLNANLDITISQTNVTPFGEYSMTAIISNDGFVYELGVHFPEEVYNANFTLRKMEPDGKTGNCLTDSLVLNTGSYTFTATPLNAVAAKEPVLPITLTRMEANRRIALNKQNCVSKSICDTLFLTGPASLCDTSLFTISTHRSIGCTAPVSWSFDTSLLSIVNRTDTVLQLRFRKSGHTVVRAILANGCKIFADSLVLQSSIAADSLELGPAINLCPNTTVTLSASKNFAQYLWQDGSTDSTFQVTQPGVYYVTATTFCGANLSDTVLVNPAFPVSIDIGPDKTYCSNDTVKLSAPPGFINYAWYNNFSNDTLHAQSIVVQPAVSSNYYLVAEKTRGCFARDTIQIFIQHADPLYLGKDSSFCQGDSLILRADGPFSSYRWSTGDTSVSLRVRAAGSYWVSAKNAFECVSKDTITVPFVYTNPKIDVNKNPVICKGESRLLVAGTGNASYTWYDGSTQATHSVTTTGVYWVAATDAHGCHNSDTVKITSEVMPPQHFLSADTTFCAYQQLMLAPASTFASYSWSTGATTGAVTVSKPGQYTLTVTDNAGCIGKDTILVNLKECGKGIFFPSAFSPNGDGNNDVFRPRVYGQLNNYLLQVYNRYGQLIFSTNDYLTGWDGKPKGKLQDNNGYVWICKWQFTGEKDEFRKGTVVFLK